ncbi:MAG: PHP domain-containing protein [Promethearchaeota archaeon]
MHSIFSDGHYWPEKLAERLNEKSIKFAALTDHDNYKGITRFENACKMRGIVVTHGVEIDCSENIPGVRYKGEELPSFHYGSEILAYFPNGMNDDFKKFIDGRIKARLKIMENYLENARKIFNSNSLTMEALFKFRCEKQHLKGEKIDDFTYMKNHLYNFLKHENIIPKEMNYKKFKSYYFSKENLKNYLGKNIDPLLLEKPTLRSVIKKIKKSSGVAILPHVGKDMGKNLQEKIKNKKIKSLLIFAKSAGIDGIELYWDYKAFRNKGKEGIELHQAFNDYLKSLAIELKFNFTCGSDFHGDEHGHQVLETHDCSMTTFNAWKINKD